MATALVPAPKDIGLASPALGPWFLKDGAGDLTLSAPDPATLSVRVDVPPNSRWLPPATGLLSLHVASAPPPKALAGLRSPSGGLPFAENKMVVLFTLLPEVEARLYELSAAIPSPDGVAVTGVPTRLRVRHIAIELAETSSDLGNFFVHFAGVPANLTQEERAAYLGLRLDNGRLVNSDTPIADLRRPGTLPIVSATEPLLFFEGGGNIGLFAFDDRGRPIDPGAVAAWWSYLATTSFNNLWAPGDTKRTIGVAPARTVHVVNAHDGVLDGAILSRASVKNVNGQAPVFTQGIGAVQITFSTAPDPDNAPLPRAGLLPHGNYGSSLNLWSADNSLARDFVRVTIVDIESHLLGQQRISAPGAAAPAQRRAADQNRASTRVLVAPSTVTPSLLADIGGASGAVFNSVLPASPPSGSTTTIVSSVLDRDWGPFPALTASGPLPATLPAVSVFPLTGGDGQLQGATIAGQRVVMRVSLGAALAGAWLRAFPQGFDALTGRHFAMDGGAGRADAAGDVVLVATLPEGALNAGRLAVTFVLASGTKLRHYGEQRFVRPSPTGGTAVSITAAGTSNIILCEQGVRVQGSALAAAAAPGTTIVTEVGIAPNLSYTLVDSSSLTASHMLPTTVANRIGTGDRVELTQPAFKKVPVPSPAGALTATGATVNETTRTGFKTLLTPSQPFPGMERLETAAVTVAANSATAAVLSAPMLARYQEMPPAQGGYPGAPASPEVHGTGVALDNNAAMAVAEFVAQRSSKSLNDLVKDMGSAPAPPTNPTTPSRWAAALKTIGAGVEGRIPRDELINIDLDSFPYDGKYSDVRTWYQNEIVKPLGVNPPFNIGLLPSIADTDAKAVPAMRVAARRVHAQRYGCQEGAVSLIAAVSRAEDFIYIETPALDNLDFGDTDDTRNFVASLAARLHANPRLCVALCVSMEMMPGYPKMLGEFRDIQMLNAIAAVRDEAGPERLAVFIPNTVPGRRLHFASTTIIVDDVYAVTGTTHPWRRGLTFDSSLAVAVFDEVLQHGRPKDIRDFRRALIAGRLGLPPTGIPDDAAQLLDAIRIMGQRGSARVSSEIVLRPKETPPTPDQPTNTDRDLWNPDGSVSPAKFNLALWLAKMAILNSPDSEVN